MIAALFPGLFAASGWGWVALAAVLLAAEILTGTQHLLLIGLAAAATGLVTLTLPAAIAQDALVFLVALALVYALWGWRQARRARTHEPSRLDALIGREALLITPLGAGGGRIGLDDSSWSVSGPDLPEGTRVTITGYEGTVLKVLPVERISAP